MSITSKIKGGILHPCRTFKRGYLNTLRFIGYDGLIKMTLKDIKLKMFVDPNDIGISKDLFLYGSREDTATQMFRSYLKPGQCVLDIGANIGYYTLIEAELIGPSGNVYALEPNRRNFEILQKNVALNGFSDIVDIELAAASDKTGTDKLHVATRSNLHTLVRTPSMDSYVDFVGVVDVNTYRIDDFLEIKGVSPRSLDIIRMDIEGHELKALKGMEKALNDSNDLVMFIEIHPKIIKENYGYDSYLSFLSELECYGFELLECALSLSSRKDQRLNLTSIEDLKDCHEAVEVFLKKH